MRRYGILAVVVAFFLFLTTAVIHPQAWDDLGSSSKKFRDLYLDSTAYIDEAIIFEGSTADNNETTLSITDPTADRAVTIPDASGTVLVGTVSSGLATYGVPLQTIKNADGTSLATSASSNQFAIKVGGWGTGTVKLQTEAASNNSKTDTCFFEFVLPPEYVAGGTVKLRLTARENDEAAVSTTLPGDRLEVYIRLTVDDTGGSGGQAEIGKVELLCDLGS